MRAKRVLIVGGGSAGWTAAAYLNAAVNTKDRRFAEIALVESPTVPRIGVGEATIPNINKTLAVIGIDELEFMKAVDGTFKQSIRYVNWIDNSGDFYHHPFCRYAAGAADDGGRRWLMSDRSVPFMDTVSAQGRFCEMGLSPKTLKNDDGGLSMVYAFHMDALKFADYLTGHATARGVTHHVDNVVDVDLQEDGSIAAVLTESGARLEADLFVDSTGFAAHLIEKKLDVGFEDCSQWLLCDRAVTMNVFHEDHFTGTVRPYTTATALSAGWVWEIPLQTRLSLGYVHASDFIDEDRAEAELRAFAGSHTASMETRTVHFKVGRRERQWAKNCVSIGLAGGFIEPLESTGLYLSQVASEALAEYFPYGDDLAPYAYRFNRVMANRFYEILDFINMHYCLSQRRDTEFWREIARPERINDRLRAKLEYWRTKPPSGYDFEDQFFPGQPAAGLAAGNGPADVRGPVDTGRLWNHHSYENILYGMDFLRAECDDWYGASRPRTEVLRSVMNAVRSGPRNLPPHHVWLQQMAGMADYPPTLKVPE